MCVEHVPSFNSMVVFAVPRMHAVAPVLVDSRPRFSLFGWWLAAGKLYELDDTPTPGADAEEVEYVDVEQIKRARMPMRTGAQGHVDGASRPRARMNGGVKKNRKAKKARDVVRGAR